MNVEDFINVEDGRVIVWSPNGMGITIPVSATSDQQRQAIVRDIQDALRSWNELDLKNQTKTIKE